jgi:Cu/Ag efflux protein CusF
VRFALQQQHAGEYAIARLSTEDDESELTVQTPSDEQADTRAGAREAEAAEEEGIRAEGMAVIVGIDRPARRLELEHGPIEALGWPAMTMVFDVADGVNLEGLEPGQRIRFTLGRPDGQAYVVEHIEAEETGAEPGAHDHD